MKKKMFAWMIAACMAMTAFTGCSGNSASDSGKQEQAETKAAVSEKQEDTAQETAAADAVRLKLSYNSPELTRETCLETEFAQTFKDYLEENAPGRFDVQIFPAAQLGSFSEVLSGVSDGNIETALVNISTLISNDPGLNVWQIPGSIKSNEECNAFLADETMRKTFDTVESAMGIDVVTSFSAGARHFTNNKKEIRVPDDMKGIVFRVMENELYVKMVESMGGIATPMSSSELYSALQNGVVDGQENPTAFIISDLTYEVQKYMVTDGHVYSISPFVVNHQWFESLPEDLKPVFLEAVEAAREAAIAFVDRQEEEGLQFLKDEGIAVYEPTEEELALWHDAVYDGTYEYIVDLIGKETVDSFIAEIENYRSSH